MQIPAKAHSLSNTTNPPVHIYIGVRPCAADASTSLSSFLEDVNLVLQPLSQSLSAIRSFSKLFSVRRCVLQDPIPGRCRVVHRFGILLPYSIHSSTLLYELSYNSSMPSSLPFEALHSSHLETSPKSRSSVCLIHIHMSSLSRVEMC